MKLFFLFLIAFVNISITTCHEDHNTNSDFSRRNINKAKKRDLSKIEINDKIKLHYSSEIPITKGDGEVIDVKKFKPVAPLNEVKENQAANNDQKNSKLNLKNENITMTHVIEHKNSFFERFIDNKIALVSISVLIISTPSIPAFIILYFIQKFSNSKKPESYMITEKISKLMACFACGSILGNVFLNIIPQITESKDYSL